MKTRTFLTIALLCVAFARCFATDDPYPVYLAHLADQINATHPTQGWSYKGIQVDSAGWTNYFLHEASNNSDYLTIHVPGPGARLDVAFVGDSIANEMKFYKLRPDLATLNAAISADHCTPEVKRLPEILALAPRALAIACGMDDVFQQADLTPIQTAMLNMVATARNSKVPVIIATLTPILPVLPLRTHDSPMIIAQRIRTVNTWIRNQAAPNGYVVWDCWLNLARSAGNYGIPMCYSTDGIHPSYCQQLQMGGFGYALGKTGWK